MRDVQWFSVVEGGGGWCRVVLCGPVGSIFVVLLIETDRRFIIKLTEDIWKVRISFVRTRDSYTITLGYNQTPRSHNIYVEGGSWEDDVTYWM